MQPKTHTHTSPFAATSAAPKPFLLQAAEGAVYPTFCASLTRAISSAANLRSTALFCLLTSVSAFCSGAIHTDLSTTRPLFSSFEDLTDICGSVDFPATSVCPTSCWNDSIAHLAQPSLTSSSWPIADTENWVALHITNFLFSTPFFTAFCGGAFTLTILHGIVVAFCRGAFSDCAIFIFQFYWH